MNFELTLLTNPPYIDPPPRLVSWFNWLLFLRMLLALFYQQMQMIKAAPRMTTFKWRRGILSFCS
jgi:hypothetical protein